MIAAIYSRKSKFTGKGESVENQIQLCKEYALRINITDFVVYEDEGFSGGNTDRPEFKRMLRDAKLKKFGTLICYRLDRISRNIADFSTLINELSNLNIEFISIREQFDTTTPLGRAMMYISSVFAQLERETIAERIRDNMMQLAKTGRWLGGTSPFGFRSEQVINHDANLKERKMYKLVPVPDEIKIANLIYNKYLEFKSIFRVAKYLDASNIKLRNYKNINPAYVGEILSNPVYATATEEIFDYFKSKGADIIGELDGIHGLLAYNKTNGNSGKRGKKDISEWIIAVSHHEGIIPGDMWVKVQNLKEKNTQAPPNLGKTTAVSLAGLMRCAKCGSPMSVIYGVKRNDGSRPYYYKCSNKILNKSNCDNTNIGAEDIEKKVIEELKGMSSNSSRFIKKLKQALKQKDTDVVVNEYENITKTISKNESSIQNLVLQMAMLSPEASKFLRDKVEELTKQNIELKVRLSEIEAKKEEIEASQLNFELLHKSLIEFKDIIDNCKTNEEKSEVIRKVVNKIFWNGETQKIQIELLKL